MTLTNRIVLCNKLAREADTLEECEGYIAEMAGLMGVPLSQGLGHYQHRYMVGYTDRATLERLREDGLGA